MSLLLSLRTLGSLIFFFACLSPSPSLYSAIPKITQGPGLSSPAGQFSWPSLAKGGGLCRVMKVRIEREGDGESDEMDDR